MDYYKNKINTLINTNGDDPDIDYYNNFLDRLVVISKKL